MPSQPPFPALCKGRVPILHWHTRPFCTSSQVQAPVNCRWESQGTAGTLRPGWPGGSSPFGWAPAWGRVAPAGPPPLAGGRGVAPGVGGAEGPIELTLLQGAGPAPPVQFPPPRCPSPSIAHITAAQGTRPAAGKSAPQTATRSQTTASYLCTACCPPGRGTQQLRVVPTSVHGRETPCSPRGASASGLPLLARTAELTT